MSEKTQGVDTPNDALDFAKLPQGNVEPEPRFPIAIPTASYARRSAFQDVLGFLVWLHTMYPDHPTLDLSSLHASGKEGAVARHELRKLFDEWDQGPALTGWRV